MEYFLVFIAGMAAAMLILRWAINRAIDRMLDRMAQEDTAQTVATDAQNMELRVELDNNVYFCYNKADGAFVCQGNNLTELQQNFQNRFPGTSGTIVEGDSASVTWLKTELLKNND